MSDQEQKSVLTISVMAAFADGRKDEQERAQIKRIFDSLAPGGGIDMPALYQDVLLQRISLETAAARIGSPEARQLAYEMAVCVCDADGVASEAESAFLERLAAVLALEAGPARAFARDAEEIAGTALSAGALSADTGPAAAAQSAVDTAELDKMVLNYSLLNGALELLPQSLASMAILPLQTKMVYRIGKAYGFELDRGHIKEFAATLGVGLAGQYVEQIGRKLIGGMLKKVGGPLGMLGGAATGSAFSFATTYALGHVARQYYSSGRAIDTARLKQLFSSLIDQGKSLQQNYSGEIQQKARNIDLSQIASLVRQQ
ncbi:MAG: GTPase [Candidatus Solibacter sp.]|nr:GTPase [Candidatus Solibacter sp.]